MNNCIFTGRFVADPETRYSNGENASVITNFTLAVNRKFKREGEPDADFLRFTAFGRHAENIGKLFHKGKPIVIEQSHVQTGSYKNKEGATVYTTTFIVDNWGFADKDNTANEEPTTTAPARNTTSRQTHTRDNSFMNMPSNMDEELPY